MKTKETGKYYTTSFRHTRAVYAAIEAYVKRLGVEKSRLLINAITLLPVEYERLVDLNKRLMDQIDRLAEENARLRGDEPMTLKMLGRHVLHKSEDVIH